MKCQSNVCRLAEVLAELRAIIDDPENSCDHDQCELLRCVVHDSLQKLERALGNWTHPDRLHLLTGIDAIRDDSKRPAN